MPDSLRGRSDSRMAIALEVREAIRKHRNGASLAFPSDPRRDGRGIPAGPKPSSQIGGER